VTESPLTAYRCTKVQLYESPFADKQAAVLCLHQAIRMAHALDTVTLKAFRSASAEIAGKLKVCVAQSVRIRPELVASVHRAKAPQRDLREGARTQAVNAPRHAMWRASWQRDTEMACARCRRRHDQMHAGTPYQGH
jgi:hypothetical protein